VADEHRTHVPADRCVPPLRSTSLWILPMVELYVKLRSSGDMLPENW
jgi:hypothetical protein